MTTATLSDQDALNLAEKALTRAKSLGCTEAEVGVRAGQGMTVTARNGELETLEHHQDKSLSITVFRNGSKGSAATTDFSEQSMAQTVSAANDIAEQSEADEFAGLLEAEYLATQIPDLDLYHEWNTDNEQLIEITLECDASAKQVDQRIEQIDDTSVNYYRGLSAYANSSGFSGAYRASRYGISCVVVANADGAMQRGYWYSSARDPADLQDHKTIGRIAGERTVRKLGARKIPTEKVPVLFEAPVAAGLFGHFISGISGGSLYRKASFLIDSKGKQIFPKLVTLDEQPHLKKGIASAPYDSEGGQTKQRLIVDEGVVQDYVLSAYSARRLGLKPTGNAGGVHNLLVSHGSNSFEQLIKTMNRGLIVTDLMGFGINMVTGDYSRGASGYWVEDGEIAFPVEEITVAGNLAEMFMHIVDIGNDVDRRGSIQSGSVLIESMTLAGA
ncbi:MAG: metalloprotease PmbA [Gammaproteobacteria bacterium]